MRSPGVVYVLFAFLVGPLPLPAASLSAPIPTARFAASDGDAKKDLEFVIEQPPGAASAEVYIFNKSDSNQVACVVNWYENGKLTQQQGIIHPPLVPKEKRYIGARASMVTTFEIASAWYVKS